MRSFTARLVRVEHSYEPVTLAHRAYRPSRLSAALTRTLSGCSEVLGTGTSEEAAQVGRVDPVVRRDAAQSFACGYPLEETVIGLELDAAIHTP